MPQTDEVDQYIFCLIICHRLVLLITQLQQQIPLGEVLMGGGGIHSLLHPPTLEEAQSLEVDTPRVRGVEHTPGYKVDPIGTAPTFIRFLAIDVTASVLLLWSYN